MPAKVTKIYDGTDPGGTPGRVFTASIGQEEIIQEDKFLDSLLMGMKGAVATAAVTIENFAALLSEYTLRVGPETRILANMRQLCALMKLYYGELPFIWENTDATGNDFIGGVKVPVQAPATADKPITHAATRTAATNIATETLGIYGYWDGEARGKKPIHAVRINHTTAGSTGYEALNQRIAPVGVLAGLIFQSATVFADGVIAVSIQRALLFANGQRHSQFNFLSDHYGWSGRSVGVLDPMDDLMNVFNLIDLRGQGGIDAKGQELTLSLDVEDASDAIVIIPVIEMA